jgi:hypothetical protein
MVEGDRPLIEDWSSGWIVEQPLHPIPQPPDLALEVLKLSDEHHRLLSIKSWRTHPQHGNRSPEAFKLVLTLHRTNIRS